jgi:hypothetical protein
MFCCACQIGLAAYYLFHSSEHVVATASRGFFHTRQTPWLNAAPGRVHCKDGGAWLRPCNGAAFKRGFQPEPCGREGLHHLQGSGLHCLSSSVDVPGCTARQSACSRRGSQGRHRGGGGGFWADGSGSLFHLNLMLSARTSILLALVCGFWLWCSGALAELCCGEAEKNSIPNFCYSYY